MYALLVCLHGENCFSSEYHILRDTLTKWSSPKNENHVIGIFKLEKENFF